MTSKQIGAAPSAATDSATKGYVDALQYSAGGLNPADYGMLAWTFDPETAATVAPSTGRVYGMRFRAAVAGTITKLNIYASAGGTTMTNAYFGIWDLSGTLLASTLDVKATLAGTGNLQVSLQAGLTVTAGQQLVVGILVVGGTAPTLAMKSSVAAINIGMTAGGSTPIRSFVTSATTLTALPSPLVYTGTVNSASGGLLCLFS